MCTKRWRSEGQLPKKMGLEEMDLDLPQSSAKGHFLMRPNAFQSDDIAVHVKDRKPRIVRFNSLV